MNGHPAGSPCSRRQFLRGGARLLAVTGVGGLAGVLATRASAQTTRWQIDPAKCVRCGNCATKCVLKQSAVKCVHAFAMCGYCQLCTGYFEPEPNALTTAAENQLCPTNAIKRTYVEDPYYEYTIDEELCIGCAKCVEGFARCGRGDNLEFALREVSPEHGAHRGVVVDHEHPPAQGALSSGRNTEKQLPLPTEVSTSSQPRCSFTMP